MVTVIFLSPRVFPFKGGKQGEGAVTSVPLDHRLQGLNAGYSNQRMPTQLLLPRGQLLSVTAPALLTFSSVVFPLKQETGFVWILPWQPGLSMLHLNGWSQNIYNQRHLSNANNSSVCPKELQKKYQFINHPHCFCVHYWWNIRQCSLKVNKLGQLSKITFWDLSES